MDIIVTKKELNNKIREAINKFSDNFGKRINEVSITDKNFSITESIERNFFIFSKKFEKIETKYDTSDLINYDYHNDGSIYSSYINNEQLKKFVNSIESQVKSACENIFRDQMSSDRMNYENLFRLVLQELKEVVDIERAEKIQLEFQLNDLIKKINDYQSSFSSDEDIKLKNSAFNEKILSSMNKIEKIYKNCNIFFNNEKILSESDFVSKINSLISHGKKFKKISMDIIINLSKDYISIRNDFEENKKRDIISIEIEKNKNIKLVGELDFFEKLYLKKGEELNKIEIQYDYLKYEIFSLEKQSISNNKEKNELYEKIIKLENEKQEIIQELKKIKELSFLRKIKLDIILFLDSTRIIMPSFFESILNSAEASVLFSEISSSKEWQYSSWAIILSLLALSIFSNIYKLFKFSFLIFKNIIQNFLKLLKIKRKRLE